MVDKQIPHDKERRCGQCRIIDIDIGNDLALIGDAACQTQDRTRDEQHLDKNRQQARQPGMQARTSPQADGQAGTSDDARLCGQAVDRAFKLHDPRLQEDDKNQEYH